MQLEYFLMLVPREFEYYRKGWDIEQQRCDYNAWLSGIYISRAIASCFNKKSEYPKEPFSIKQHQESQESQAKTQAAGFRAWAEEFNKNFRKKQIMEEIEGE